eukprot:COSAG02_NODE_17755_length_983_cov_2.002262_2_plen_77_part_00
MARDTLETARDTLLKETYLVPNERDPDWEVDPRRRVLGEHQFCCIISRRIISGRQEFLMPSSRETPHGAIKDQSNQ